MPLQYCWHLIPNTWPLLQSTNVSIVPHADQADTVAMQSAFKRASPSSGNFAPAPRVMPEWDTVKTEDKTLVYQVHSLCPANLGSCAWHLSTSICIHCVVQQFQDTCTTAMRVVRLKMQPSQSEWLLCKFAQLLLCINAINTHDGGYADRRQAKQ